MAKKNFWVGVMVIALVGFMVVSCASFKAVYEDNAIFAELVVNDNDWVVLTIKNNFSSTIQLLAEKSFYSNVANAMNTTLVPISDEYNPGLKIVPIPIQPGRTVVQRFAAPAYIQYKRGEVDNIDNWTPRGKNDIKTASFVFEYEINGETKQLIFEQFN